MGIGDWGLGIGEGKYFVFPNPQSLTPNPRAGGAYG